MPYFYPGDTVTLGAGDLALNDVPVTAGAIVSVTLLDPAGAVVFTEVADTVIDDDWTFTVNLPDSPPGRYTVKVTATASGATWKGKIEDLWIRAF